jgi:hypothetical protein
VPLRTNNGPKVNNGPYQYRVTVRVRVSNLPCLGLIDRFVRSFPFISCI